MTAASDFSTRQWAANRSRIPTRDVVTKVFRLHLALGKGQDSKYRLRLRSRLTIPIQFHKDKLCLGNCVWRWTGPGDQKKDSTGTRFC